jgi:hypothetical protein
LDKPLARHFVLAFRISSFTFLEGAFDIDLIEMVAQELLPQEFPVIPVRRDERGQHDKAGVHQQGGDFSDPPDILASVLSAEPQVRIHSEPDVVAIQDIRPDAAGIKFLFHPVGYSGLAGPGKSGKPQQAAGMLVEEVSVPAVEVAVMRYNQDTIGGAECGVRRVVFGSTSQYFI